MAIYPVFFSILAHNANMRLLQEFRIQAATAAIVVFLRQSLFTQIVFSFDFELQGFWDIRYERVDHVSHEKDDVFEHDDEDQFDR